MNVTVTDVSELRKQLVVSLSAEEVVQEENSILNEFRKHAKVPGFRPGKAPANMLRQRYKKELNEELGKAVSNKAVRESIQEKELKVYDIVSITGIEEIRPGAEATIDITLDLEPTFEVPAYEGIETTVPGAEVTDEEVAEAVENLRRQRADFEEVDRPSAAGDYVKLTYSGSVEGTPVSDLIEDAAASDKPWIALENGWEEAGTDEAKEYGVPEIIDAIVGVSAGDEKSVEVSIADDFKIEALRGKTVTYTIQIHEVRERKLPELDEAFFKSINVESEEDLKDRILDNLEGRKKQQQREASREQVVEKLLGGVQFPVPEVGLERETQNVMGRIMVENLQRGVPHEEFENNKEALHAQAHGIAERDLRLQLILFKIAEKESIELTQDDLQRGIMGMAQQRRQSPEELVKELRKNRNSLQSLQRQLLLGKTLDFVVDKATVTVSAKAPESA